MCSALFTKWVLFSNFPNFFFFFSRAIFALPFFTTAKKQPHETRLQKKIKWKTYFRKNIKVLSEWVENPCGSNQSRLLNELKNIVVKTDIYTRLLLSTVQSTEENMQESSWKWRSERERENARLCVCVSAKLFLPPRRSWMKTAKERELINLRAGRNSNSKAAVMKRKARYWEWNVCKCLPRKEIFRVFSNGFWIFKK